MLGIGKNLALSKLVGNLGLAPTITQALQTMLQSGDNRAAFIAALTATAANASKKPNFNLELEINDLWTRLGNLRDASPGGGFSGAVNQLQDVQQSLFKTLEALSKNVK